MPAAAVRAATATAIRALHPWADTELEVPCSKRHPHQPVSAKSTAEIKPSHPWRVPNGDQPLRKKAEAGPLIEPKTTKATPQRATERWACRKARGRGRPFRRRFLRARPREKAHPTKQSAPVIAMGCP